MFTGVHIVEPSILDRLPKSGQSCIVRQGYLPALRDGEVLTAYVTPGYFFEHSTPARYLQGNINALRGCAAAPSAGAAVGVSARAQISPRAVIRPPVCIGAGAVVEDGAVVGPDVVLGEGRTSSAACTSSAAWCLPASMCGSRRAMPSSPVAPAMAAWPARHRDKL